MSALIYKLLCSSNDKMTDVHLGKVDRWSLQKIFIFNTVSYNYANNILNILNVFVFVTVPSHDGLNSQVQRDPSHLHLIFLDFCFVPKTQYFSEHVISISSSTLNIFFPIGFVLTAPCMGNPSRQMISVGIKMRLLL